MTFGFGGFGRRDVFFRRRRFVPIEIEIEIERRRRIEIEIELERRRRLEFGRRGRFI